MITIVVSGLKKALSGIAEAVHSDELLLFSIIAYVMFIYLVS